MKQLSMEFKGRKKQEQVTIQRLQQVVDLVADGAALCDALNDSNLSGNMGKYLVQANIFKRVTGRKVIVLVPKLQRRHYYKVRELQKKYNQERHNKKQPYWFNTVKANTDMVGLVNLPKATEPTNPVQLQRTRKPRVKKIVALPWWKRFLLYLLNK